MRGPCACPGWGGLALASDARPTGSHPHQDKHKAPTLPHVRPLSLQDGGRHYPFWSSHIIRTGEAVPYIILVFGWQKPSEPGRTVSRHSRFRLATFTGGVCVACRGLAYEGGEYGVVAFTFLAQWEGEAECGACSFAALEPHLAVMAFDDLVRDIEADAKSGIGIYFGVVGTVEALKKMFV